MKKEKSDEVVVEQEESAQVPDQERREFVSKLVTAAGLIAVAGIAGAASAETIKIPAGGPSTIKTDPSVMIDKDLKNQMVFPKVGKLRNGFTMTFKGGPIGQAMIDAGIAPPGTPIQNATIRIEFTA